MIQRKHFKQYLFLNKRFTVPDDFITEYQIYSDYDTIYSYEDENHINIKALSSQG